MKEPSQDRSLEKLNGVVRELLALAVEDLRKQGVAPLIVETYRTKERQMWLYGQGRTAKQLAAKGVPAEYAHSGAIVTQTLNSIHKTGCAIDIIPVRNGKAIWDANDADTKKIIATMTKYGFEAGANWKSFKDSPHYQIKLPQPKYNSISSSNSTEFLTKVIQSKLKITADGKWGKKTDEALIAWRKAHKLTATPVLYAANFKTLFE
ncbi:MAG: M15 family metallopeptidase [Lachnospiraceae bacterium]|nr:M15 family metallopeptidase [Lachnospiraceae bacterium]